MLFEILQTGRGFFEAFRLTFQIAAVLALISAGLLALLPRRIVH
jgi:hypothetical protein